MRIIKNNQGSILIWTFFLGMVLTSVFFFFAQRLGFSTMSQRGFTEQLSARNFLKSYADYIEQLSLSDIQSMKGDLVFEGITGHLSNETDFIERSLDPGQEDAYDFSDTIRIEWNLCSANAKADLVLSGNADIQYVHDTSSPSCSASSPSYDDEVTVAVSNPFTIKSLSTPFHYRLSSSATGHLLPDDQWTLTLEYPLESGRIIKLVRSFIPS